ncbi:MAG: hypothetical protein JKY37_18595 [Nannocystaceae bacterium]|nr:hypothetical protein [Nannocystaceae bacterium]
MVRRWLLVFPFVFAGGCKPLPQASPMTAVANPEQGYQFDAEESAYLDELDRMRREADLDPVDRVRDSADESIIAQATDRIRSGSPVDEELHALIGHFSKKINVPFTAMTLVPIELNGWIPEYPAELLTRPRVGAIVSILHVGDQYVVLVIFGDLDFTP